MEVRPGYKQTEVAVIPEDWECTSVSRLVRDGILEKPLDGNHGNIHPKSGDFVSFGIPFVMANNVRGGRVDVSNCTFIRKEQADSLQKGLATVIETTRFAWPFSSSPGTRPRPPTERDATVFLFGMASDVSS